MTNDVKSSSESNRPRTQVPAVMETLRTRSLQRLGDLLKGMFDRLENIVYEWARNLPEAEQSPYLAVITGARGRRADMESRFVSAMASSFMALIKGSAEKSGTRSSGGLSSVDFSNLSLVNEEEMDITVMVDSMVARARLDYAAPLGLLRRRFAHLFPKQEISERNMPLDPAPIVGAFKESMTLLDLSIQEKMLVWRVFQEQLFGDLGMVLDEANQLLIEAGVLPDLKVAPNPGASAANKKAPAAPRPDKRDETPKSPKAQGDTEEILAFMKSHLGAAGVRSPGMTVPGAQYHGGQYVGGGGIGALPAASIGGSVAAVPIAPQNIAPTATVQTVATPELITLLSQIQQLQPKASLAEDASSPSVEQVRGSIRDNLRSDEETVEAVKQADEDVINLVSMLFDFILDDDDLPTAMKALIGRLQIPLLKVAILDKSFFNAETHPARRLLNALAKAGIGWNSKEPGGDVLYAKIEQVVFRILNDFIDDIGLFDELLEEFSEFHEQQQKREDVVDKRTRETEEGRARADVARAMVQQTLNRRLTGRHVPLVVVRLLHDAWRQVLYINCLKEGTESEAWKQAVKVVDAVVWSVLPQPSAEWQGRLRDVSPKLANSLKKGLTSVNYDPLTTETLLRELTQVHMELLRGEEARTVNVLDAKTAELKPEAGQVAVAEVAKANAANVAAVVMPEAETTPPVENALPQDNEYVVMVDRLSVGSWVEFTTAEKQDRHKLVARIRSIDKLIFADRRGVKVAEMAGMKLAVDMSLGRARVLEQVEFIDRALETMMGNLRDISAKTAKS